MLILISQLRLGFRLFKASGKEARLGKLVLRVSCGIRVLFGVQLERVSVSLGLRTGKWTKTLKVGLSDGERAVQAAIR